ncbi:hypothetical protein WL34_01695 [Burkholderia cepacia]|nr:hypothetical protein WL34_01695 [Burkholderia cepacia]
MTPIRWGLDLSDDEAQVLVDVRDCWRQNSYERIPVDNAVHRQVVIWPRPLLVFDTFTRCRLPLPQLLIYSVQWIFSGSIQHLRSNTVEYSQ